jgi:CHAT domain-containing protein
VYLVEGHSLQRISGASMWADRRPDRDGSSGAFVGVGDAIYNTADARWKNSEGPAQQFLRQVGWPWKAGAAAQPPLALGRLAGSGLEIEACARQWRGAKQLFEGRDATRENIRRALAERPAVMHFATHVLEGAAQTSSGKIALSIAEGGREELLGASEISGWNADAGVIVLSGCSSGVGAARPGSGLMGLTRAWLMAGARAVVATEWQTTDDIGVFFQRFYRHLGSSATGDPAAALAAAQRETSRSHDWRSQPSFWAAYFALGNY